MPPGGDKSILLRLLQSSLLLPYARWRRQIHSPEAATVVIAAPICPAMADPCAKYGEKRWKGEVTGGSASPVATDGSTYLESTVIVVVPLSRCFAPPHRRRGIMLTRLCKGRRWCRSNGRHERGSVGGRSAVASLGKGKGSVGGSVQAGQWRGEATPAGARAVAGGEKARGQSMAAAECGYRSRSREGGGTEGRRVIDREVRRRRSTWARGRGTEGGLRVSFGKSKT
uniref:Uncharacterized protein n=1 Tax=Oryza rufipogon TaxID=4529 RepID=A0A0E0NVS2_ORYRU